MKTVKKNRIGMGLAAVLLLAAGGAWANNLQITNVTVTGRDDTTAYVQFDISWENSWRYTNINHDAAWVFFKVLPDGRSDWEHVTLEGTGTNPTDYSIGAGTPIEMIVPADRVGMIVRRSGEGAGATAVQNVKAVWNIASNSLPKTDKVKLQTFGVEMVFVAEGAFSVGDGTSTTIQGQLEAGTSGQPFTITNEAYAITLGGGGAGSLGNNNATGMNPADDFKDGTSRTLPAAFPKGYAAFYCMKDEITQGQYADFLNALTRDQQAVRCTATTSNYYMSGTAGGSATIQYRNTVRLTEDPGSPSRRVYTTVTRDRACNWLSWADGAAFADWAGLRPMTELEFEKACRGPLEPVADEYAWGSTAISSTTAIVNDGTGTDTATGGNCNYDVCTPDGPFRVGIYATASSSRELAGAGYYGVLELSGNLWERTVAIGNATGRLFTGLHGNGVLTVGGEADVTAWPSTTAIGAGYRGGIWHYGAVYVRASDRYYAAYVSAGRNYRLCGGRVVRSAPSGVGP